jgi:dynein heavy chain 1
MPKHVNVFSVLDDNRLLTLPNGERLYLPGNVRVMFEVDSLRYATPATVSRCGMIWFSQGLVTAQMLCAKAMETLQTTVLPTDEQSQSLDSASSAMRLRTQQIVAQALAPSFLVNGLVFKALSFAETLPHIMEFSPSRALSTLFYAINKAIRTIQDYNDNHADFPLADDRIELYMRNRLLLDLVWAFVGDASGKDRAIFARFLQEETGIQLPVDANDHNTSVIDFDVDLKTGNWINWQERVPTIEIETHAVTAADVVIPTIDTVRHEEVLYSWIIERKPLVLCGPPGSGKTMTLMNALRKLPEVEMAGLNFSSATSPELILKTFEQYCEYKKNNNGIVLAPTSTTKWLVVFCDEINLPAEDTYGTQRVISFMRQMIEHGGFWRTSDLSWVKLERIQFVGACNPPTDPGRVPLSTRFLRHAPVLMVDYPGSIALKQIYGTFARALLKVVPPLRRFAEALTEAMVEVYQLSQSHFTADQQAHYVYSPRELSRWVRGIYEALRPLESLDLDGLVRLWAHEGLRLFQDRLVHEYEKVWTDQLIDDVALRHFPTIDRGLALQRPILYSNWTTKDYLPIGREALRDFVKARLRVFYEEELDVPLVLYDDILDHVLRIDRVFRQPQGHVLLIGVSGSGKVSRHLPIQ